MKVRAHQYDTVDALCWRHYGRTQGVTEQVLKANPGLAEYGPFLPHGLQVELPDIPTTTTVQTVQLTAVRGRWPGVYREQTEMKKKLISGLFLMLWMALLIAAMVYPQGIFPVLAASGVWVACLLTWAVIPVAARHKLKMALGKDLSDKPVEHIDQTNESDGSFLMRLARQYGAIASVKNGNLLFIRQGQGKSATGKPLPVITITRKDGDSHRFTLADRGAYTGVIASWLHTREPAKKESTTVKRKRRTKKQKKEPEAKQGDYLVGTDENVLVLNRTYANRSNAERAAKMQWERLQRGVASFSLQLAEGRADLYTEMPVKVSGFKQPIDDAEWTITTLTHTVSPDNGFTTSLELEVRIDDFEME